MEDTIEFAGDYIAPKEDLPIAKRPDDPTMRDGVNVWFFEENGEFGVPRLAVDAVGPDWDNRLVCANFAFADGRVLDGWQHYPAVSNLDDDGQSTVLGCEALQFRCIEPMKRWRVAYDAEPIDTDSANQIAKTEDSSRRTRVRLEADIVLKPPFWSQFFTDDDERPEAGWMGRGWRYEVPCTVEGTLEIDGKNRPFKGTGSLVRRKSKRTSSVDFPGHCWLAARFPDGRAFGCNVYPPKDGAMYYNTGYIHLDGRTYDAKVVEAPWLRDLSFEGEDMPVVLETELGRMRIDGTSLLSTFKPTWTLMGGLNLHQGAVRFTWDDQSAIGMTERSSFPVE